MSEAMAADAEIKDQDISKFHEMSDSEKKEFLGTPEGRKAILNPNLRKELVVGKSGPQVLEEPVQEESVSEPLIEDKAEKAAGDNESLDVLDGYKSKEEMKEHIDRLQKLTDDQKSQLDDFNAERGKNGQKVKDLEEKVAEYNRELSEAKESGVKTDEKPLVVDPSAFVLPEAPIPPEGDVFDEGYLKAKSEYDAKVQKSFNTFAKAFGALEEKSRNLEGKLSEVAEYVSSDRENQIKESVDNSTKSIYSEVEGLQNNFGDLKTSVPFGDIDVQVARYGWDHVKQKLNPSDLSAVSRIYEVLASYGSKDESGIFNKKFKNIGEANVLHMYRTGRSAENKEDGPSPEAIKAEGMSAGAAAVSDKITERSKTAVSIPNSQMQPKDSINEMSPEARMKRFSDLTSRYRANPQAFYESSEFAEWESLAKGYGVKTPNIKLQR